MPKLYDMWTELKTWLADNEIEDMLFVYEVQDKMDELESEYE